MNERDILPTMDKGTSPTTKKDIPASPELSYKFTQFDIGNSDIVTIQEGTLSFSLATSRGFRGLIESTTLRFYDADGNSTPGGLLDWKNKTIEVLGESKPWAEIKSKPGKALSSTREWMWLNKKYVTSFKNGDCTVKLGSEILAILTSPRARTLSKDEPATLTFYSEIPKPETLFVIFAIVFGALRHPHRNKRLTPAAVAGEVTSGIAAGVAADATVGAPYSGSCTIQ